jgi:hypothetical protein
MLAPAVSRVAVVRTTAAVVLGFAVGILAAIVGVASARGPRPPPATTFVVASSHVVDVSHASIGAAGALDTMVGLIRLAPDERVIAVDGEIDADGLGRLATTWPTVAPGDFVDLEIRNAAGEIRRVVLLVHR